MADTARARDDALAALTGGGGRNGTGDSLATPGVDTKTKKSRRATVYPSAVKTNKPFSRSAAKRESVLALGSIEHLQHYFTKTGTRARIK